MYAILCFASFLVCVFGKKLPSFVEVCPDDNKLNDCLKRNVENLRPRFKKGIPELLVPSFDPLFIPGVTLNGGPNFQAKFNDINIYYADEFELKDLEYDTKKIEFRMNLHFPRMRIKGQYQIDGRILILTLNGHGPGDMNFTNIDAFVHSHGKLIKKNGKDFLKLIKLETSLTIATPRVYFANLLGDNQELSDQTNRIINENVDDFVDELKPIVSEVISGFIGGIFDGLFAKYTNAELFPPPK